MVVLASGAGAAGVAADQVSLQAGGLGRSLSSAPCLAPRTDWWFAGADGRVGYVDDLLVDNPAPTAANVTITGWSASGPLAPPRLSSVSLAPYSTLALSLAQIAPDQAYVALHVHANIGTVASAVFDRQLHGITPLGSDYDAATQPPAKRLAVTGFLPGSGQRLLEVANPGGADATVTLHLATRGANFAPAGAHTIVVKAGQSTAFYLTAAFGGDGGGVLLNSDVPVLASGLNEATTPKLPDTSWLPAGQPLTGPAVFASDDPLFGQQVDLIVTAPVTGGRLLVEGLNATKQQLSVPGGRSIVVDLRRLFHTGSGSPGPLVLVPLDHAGLVAARVIYALGAHGALLTAGAPVAVPAPLPLPPAGYDPRAALR